MRDASLHETHTETGPADCSRCQLLRDYPLSEFAAAEQQARDQMRATIMSVERRYRFASALGHAAGYANPGYTALVNLAAYFRDKPSEARDFADFHLRDFPSSARRQARNAQLVVDLLDGIEHDAPAHQISALAEYAQAVAEAGAASAPLLLSAHTADKPADLSAPDTRQSQIDAQSRSRGTDDTR